MKNILFMSLLVLLIFGSQSCGNNGFKEEKEIEPFQPPISYEKAIARADSIVQIMTIEEKIEMIGGHDIFFTKGYEKYGIPSLRFSDATQGISLDDYKDHLPNSVAFPAPILLTSTWNRELAKEYAKSVGEEAKAGGIAVLLGPGLNMYRISQCGRNFEYFGEDPFLTARMIENYVLGLQSTGTSATLKHFIANNSDFRRRTSNSVVGERALHEIYMPGFEAGINAGAMAVMTSYNQVNGEYAAQSQYVIKKLLRGDLGFKWLVMSDWLSIWNAEKAIKSGLDLYMLGETEDGVYIEEDHEEYLRQEAPKLLKEGKIQEADINRMVKKLIATAFAMEYDKYPVEDKSLLSKYSEHVKTAIETAREGIVLLKNDNNILPIKPGKKELILVTGEKVDELATGGGSAYVEGFNKVTLLDALKDHYGENVRYVMKPSDEEIKSASKIIYSAYTFAKEGSDVQFDLPGSLNDEIIRTADLNNNTVVVMYTGSGKNMTPWNDKVEGIIYCWYPGQAGNKALAEIVAGVTNPSGKLPITIEKKFEDSPGYPYMPEGEELYTGWEKDFDMDHPIHNVYYKEGIFTGYRWYEDKNIEPLYPFGFGLSYSTFEYSDLATNAETYAIDDDVLVKVDVSNTSNTDGKEIVELYVRDIESSVARPLKELKDFTKIDLKGGEKKTVYFTLKYRDFAFWDEGNSSWKVEPGDFDILIGSSSDNIKLHRKISLQD